MATKGDLFVHSQRPKKKVPPELSETLPLPAIGCRKIEALFTGYSVHVADKDSIRELCLNGGFGQGMLSKAFPACLTNVRETIRKRNGAPSNTGHAISSNQLQRTGVTFDPLCLFLEEAFFLVHQLNILTLKSNDDETIGLTEAFESFRKIKKDFFASYCAYLYLKSKNWVIKSGMKFGGDFVIYLKGPQFYHASYIVLIQEMFRGKNLSSHVIDGLDFQGFNRIAETTAKDILFLEVYYPDSLDLVDDADCLEKIKDVHIAETFTKHHNYITARNQS